MAVFKDKEGTREDEICPTAHQVKISPNVPRGALGYIETIVIASMISKDVFIGFKVYGKYPDK